MRKINLELSEKHYDPLKVEGAVTDLWDDAKVHVADNSSKKEPFTIVIPPPNVTGRLHMGHALNNTIQDALIRFKRMDGFNVLWVPGTDHAGISTQSVVKKHLDAEGIDYRELGREKMIERIWQWREKSGDKILEQLKRLGCSCDWSRTRFTMDEGLSKSVLVAFKKMYDDGLIYRGKYIVNWCPVDRTALSDEEVETKDGGEPGNLWYFQYPLVGTDSFVSIATTRPETMLGDTAIAVNPKDERFKDLIGKKALVPIVDREIPIIADDYVDAEFGTGCVKITPAHDPNDFQIGLRHDLPQITVMNEDATMNDEVPSEYRGLDRYVCRKKIVAQMDSLGFLKSVEERNIPVGRSYRSKAIIEYRLSDQWFVKMKPLAEKALKLSEAGKLSYFPERWDSFYRDWLEKTRDWCISRQIWWGHRIPAWYNKETGEILVDTDTPKAVKESPDNWSQDEDVLDTWFSSALWPYSTLGWPEKTKDFDTFFPTNVLVTAKDIIYFWVAKMVMTSLYHLDTEPFQKVLINSTICDEDGETMSKSKGNGIDPLHVIYGATLEELQEPVREARPVNIEKMLNRVEKKFPEGFSAVGADALRYTMLTTATDAQQVQISLKKFDEIGRPLTNKIWNAFKLGLSLIEQADKDSKCAKEQIEDVWIKARLQDTISQVRAAYDSYNFHLATHALYHFFWDDLCDWYLEIVKLRIKEEEGEDTKRIAETLGEVFLQFFKLLHPVMPFITEELWGHVQKATHDRGLCSALSTEEICALASFPQKQDCKLGGELLHFEALQEVIRTIRNMRAEADVASKISLDCKLLLKDTLTSECSESFVRIVKGLANIDSLDFLEKSNEKNDTSNMSSTTLSQGRVYLNLAEHRNVEADIERQVKAIAKLEKVIGGLTSKLENANFIDRAPKDIVNAEKEKLLDAQKQMESLEKTLIELRKL